MTSKDYTRGIGIGIVSGIVLGIFLKFLESLTGIKVYVLLLNVDFIPYIGEIDWSEWVEFLFHLLISCFIGIVFVMLIQLFNLSGKAVWGLAFALTVPAFLLYFPLSYLAIKEVPPPHDPAGILLWFSGHVVYGVSLPIINDLINRLTSCKRLC